MSNKNQDDTEIPPANHRIDQSYRKMLIFPLLLTSDQLARRPFLVACLRGGRWINLKLGCGENEAVPRGTALGPL